MTDLTDLQKDQRLSVLQHSLGVDAYGRGTQYRNHYCAGPGHDRFEVCQQMVSEDLMCAYPPSELTGGDWLFSVTDAGKAWMTAHSPKSPVLTRAQRRYRDYLQQDCDMTFGAWLNLKPGHR